jgi:predicted metal-dependent enzyme (double-stranded beta helix superfamily)
MSASNDYTVRDCAREIIALIDRCGADGPRLQEGLREPLGRLLQRPDLLSLGVKREANHIDFSRHLYYDGELSITLDNFPKGLTVPPHDHGVWELLAIYRGSVAHTVYERKDDGSVPGYADLSVIDDRVLGAGDLALVAMPAEIHSFTALADDTFSVTVVGGNYKPDRHYFKPEEKTCVLRSPKALRPVS